MSRLNGHVMGGYHYRLLDIHTCTHGERKVERERERERGARERNEHYQ